MRTYTPDFHELADAELVDIITEEPYATDESCVEALCERSEAFVREALGSLRVSIYNSDGRAVGSRVVIPVTV